MIGGVPKPGQTPVKLRRGGSDDLDCVVGVMNEAFDEEFGERWSRSQCAGILPMPGVRLSVVEERGAIIAFSLMRTILDESELLLIAVAPDHQARGIGRLLLDDFQVQGQSAGADRLHLEVRDGNRAVSLYKDSGFQIVGRRRDYYRGRDGNCYDALTMMLRK